MHAPLFVSSSDAVFGHSSLNVCVVLFSACGAELPLLAFSMVSGVLYFQHNSHYAAPAEREKTATCLPACQPSLQSYSTNERSSGKSLEKCVCVRVCVRACVRVQ